MRRGNAQLAALLAWILLAGNPASAANDDANLPAPGSTTSDGFTVSALWHVDYKTSWVNHGAIGVRGETYGGCPTGHPADTLEETTGHTNVSEEVNKQTGQQRAVVKSGEWHYKWDYQACDHLSSKADGGFQHPAIVHDVHDGKAMVHFLVWMAEPPNRQEVRGGLHVRNFVCDVPFQTENIEYREEKEDSGGRTLNWEWKSHIEITRTAQKIEAEIKPADGFNFKNWVPTMTGEIPFVVRVVDPPNLPVQWKFFLLGTSHHPGVCCNANIDDFPDTNAKWEYRIKKRSPDLIFDFRKYGKTDTSFKAVDEPWQVMETSKPATSVGFIVNSLDYGASGTVAAVVTNVGQPVAATYKETGEHFIRIPYSTSNEYNHRIAHAAEWPLDNVSFDYGLQSYERAGGKPDADDDVQPAGRPGCKGDGLTLFEEYRGFFVRSSFDPSAPHVHLRLNPLVKDVFIFMADDTARDLVRYLADFQNASKLNVHFVGDDLTNLFLNPQTRVVNFNRGDIGSDQHAIHLINYPFEEAGHLGECAHHLGPPGNVSMVYVAVDNINTNHGDIDKMHDPKYGELAREGGQHSGDIECAMRYVGADFYLHHSSDFEPNPQYHRYDNKREHLGLSFCNSPKGTGINEKSKPGPFKPDWYCGNAQAGNCMAQIVVNDKCGGGSGGTQDRTGSGGGSAASAPDDPAEKSARQSQSQAHISARLSAGGKTSLAVIPGEAVVFELRLGGLANASLELGKPGAPWPRQVSFKMLDANKKLVPLPASVRPAGKAMQLDPQAGKSGGSAPGEMTPSPEQIKIAQGSRHRASFALDASETAKLPAGELRIFAGISGQPLMSTSVSLTVRKLEDLSAEEQARVEAVRVLSRARLAYAEEKFADAEQLAREAAAKLPDSVEARLILARSLERQKKLREAYDAYGQALERTKPPSGKVDEPPLEIIFAMRWLREQLHIELEPPPIVAGPLAAHSLFAESGANKLNPPFPSHPDQLIFEWQLDKASDDPLGVRWIAEEVTGVEKDHVIATAKSDLNKQSGQFSLTKPTAGFQPGKYRVEIWQAGKDIYRESFQILP